MGSERELQHRAFDAEPDGPRRSRVRDQASGHVPLEALDTPVGRIPRPPTWVLIGVALLAVGSAAAAILSEGPLAVLAILCFAALAIVCATWVVLGARRQPAATQLELIGALVDAELHHVSVVSRENQVIWGGSAFGFDPLVGTGSSIGSAPPADLLHRVYPGDRADVAAWLLRVRETHRHRESFGYRLREGASWRTVRSTALNLFDVPGVDALVVTETAADADGSSTHSSAAPLVDPVTGFPNRQRLLQELTGRITRTASTGPATRSVAVFVIDVDRFKVINDSLGHEYGDALLMEIGSAVGNCLRRDDLIARAGADEFVVLSSAFASTDEAEGLAREILAAISQPITLIDQPIVATASIGIAIAEPGDDPEATLRDADIAMFRAKEAGGARFEVFEASLRQRVTRRHDTEQELRRALANDELRLLFQPIVSLSKGLVAAEALVRWEHPEKGVLGPGHFIEIAEETGLILQVGDWVLSEGCRALRRWMDAFGPACPNLTVNLSMRQLIEPNFVARVRLHLVESGVDPQRLILEITEDSLVNELDRCIPVLNELAALGAGIAIDDFGTGMSSLSHIKRLPMARTLKIDRSFVTDIAEYRTDHAIVQAVLVMAERLGVRVVAEGVETKDQLSALVELGCENIQGYLFSPPLEESALMDFRAEGLRGLGLAS